MKRSLVISLTCAAVVAALWVASLGRWVSVGCPGFALGVVDGSVIVHHAEGAKYTLFESYPMQPGDIEATLTTEHSFAGFGISYAEADELVFPMWVPLAACGVLPALAWWRRRRAKRRGFAVSEPAPNSSPQTPPP